VISQAPEAVPVSPAAGGGASQTFTFVDTDSNGASDLASAQAIFDASFGAVSSCYVLVARLGRDSQCAVNVGSSIGALSGNTYTLNLAITFEGGSIGAKNIYSYAASLGGLNSGWQTVGTWTP
jgi:hypothetical protein